MVIFVCVNLELDSTATSIRTFGLTPDFAQLSEFLAAAGVSVMKYRLVRGVTDLIISFCCS